ncbi:hypothetical protein E2R54_06095 [Microbacterium oleivorans]|uniref:ThuA-like domain-containing protein n=1 Tax=Microbacterium oleivorans TaxID=273677 RepID=A0A4R5YN00_9MICO|nr:hypothetical protein E2R54_06095 [Microbacterium oleivorans]
MTRAVVFSGGGDYVDPWHPFAETSTEIARLLREDGVEVDIVDQLGGLDPLLSAADLLILNAGGGGHPHPLDQRARHLIGGFEGGLLVVHVAATMFPADPVWEERLGGRWVRGTTMHPERGPLMLRAVGDNVLTRGIEKVETVDEAYSWLRVSDHADVLYAHEYADASHAVVWLVDHGGPRTAYSALGHDVEAYEAPEVRDLLRRLARWAASA